MYRFVVLYIAYPLPPNYKGENNRVIITEIIDKARRRQWHPSPVLLPGKSHGWRSLVGCSLWGHRESDMIEQLHFHFSLPAERYTWEAHTKA